MAIAEIAAQSIADETKAYFASSLLALYKFKKKLAAMADGQLHFYESKHFLDKYLRLAKHKLYNQKLVN